LFQSFQSLQSTPPHGGDGVIGLVLQRRFAIVCHSERSRPSGRAKNLFLRPLGFGAQVGASRLRMTKHRCNTKPDSCCNVSFIAIANLHSSLAAIFDPARAFRPEESKIPLAFVPAPRAGERGGSARQAAHRHCLFQSTPPCVGRPRNLTSRPLGRAVVSIRAPVWGRLLMPPYRFQSTPPRGGRPTTNPPSPRCAGLRRANIRLTATTNDPRSRARKPDLREESCVIPLRPQAVARPSPRLRPTSCPFPCDCYAVACPLPAVTESAQHRAARRRRPHPYRKRSHWSH